MRNNVFNQSSPLYLQVRVRVCVCEREKEKKDVTGKLSWSDFHMKIEFSPFLVCNRERERESVSVRVCVFVQERESERSSTKREKEMQKKILLLICPRWCKKVQNEHFKDFWRKHFLNLIKIEKFIWTLFFFVKVRYLLILFDVVL